MVVVPGVVQLAMLRADRLDREANIAKEMGAW